MELVSIARDSGDWTDGVCPFYVGLTERVNSRIANSVECWDHFQLQESTGKVLALSDIGGNCIQGPSVSGLIQASIVKAAKDAAKSDPVEAIARYLNEINARWGDVIRGEIRGSNGITFEIGGGL